MQLLDPVAEQHLVGDHRRTARPVDVAVPHQQPDAGADGQQVGIGLQAGDLLADLGGMPQVVVVATSDDLAAGAVDAEVAAAG